MNTVLERHICAILFFSIYPAVVSTACTSGIMNVGEQAISSDPVTSLDSTDQFVEQNSDTDSREQNSDTDSYETTSTVDVECEDNGLYYTDYCWYLGARGESCIDVCEERGGYNEATAAVVGIPEQGGTWEACRDIVRLLGFEGEVGAGYRDDGDREGFGCHFWEGDIWWLYRPDLTPEARFPDAERICSCHATITPMQTAG
jgi:hypothetical protein